MSDKAIKTSPRKCLDCEGHGVIRTYLNRAGDYEKDYCGKCEGTGHELLNPFAAPVAPREEPFTPEQVEGMAKVMLDTPWYEPAKMLEAYARLLRQPPADRPSVNCPLCGVSVEQVASATLSLALWQHVQWVCKSQNSAFSGVAQEWKA